MKCGTWGQKGLWPVRRDCVGMFSMGHMAGVRGKLSEFS
jgi:hypothetical protein